MFLLVNMRKHACSKMANSYLGPVSTICAFPDFLSPYYPYCIITPSLVSLEVQINNP